MEVGIPKPAYRMNVENAVIAENITLGDVTYQQATAEQDSTTFESTETVEGPYIPEQGPRVLRSNIDQPPVKQGVTLSNCPAVKEFEGIRDSAEYVYPLGTSDWVSGSRVASSNRMQEGREYYEHLNPSSMLYESMYNRSTFLKVGTKK